MRVLVTGGGGFLGHRLSSALLRRPLLADSADRAVELTRLVVCDIAEPTYPPPDDPRVEAEIGDVADPDFAAQILTADTVLVMHLAAAVSGAAEQDFALGMRANVEGTHVLLERCRQLGTEPRLVFASSVAVYGGNLPDVVDEATALNPQTSYGTQKAIGEHLINDYSRRHYVDGRALRLPTIVVRAGSPNRAVTSFASDLIREPLSGNDVVCPVPPETMVWILSVRRVIDCLLHAARLPAEAWGPTRVVVLPGLSVTVGEIVAALRATAGERAADRITWRNDPFITEVVSGFPTRFDTTRAERLGFRGDRDVVEIIEAFIADEVPGSAVA